MSVEDQMFRVVLNEWNRDASERESVSTPAGVPCRICMQNADPKTVLSPCRCVGTVQYVHESCLKAWLLAQGKMGTVQCELCHTPFNSEYCLGRVCKPRNLLAISKPSAALSWFGLLMQLLILAILLPVSTSLAGGPDSELRAIALGIILAVLCVIECGLVMATGYFVVKTCLPVDLKFWNIHNYDEKKVVLQEIEVTHYEPQRYSQELLDNTQRQPRID